MDNQPLNPTCIASDCCRPQRARQLCTMHSQRLDKRGSTHDPHDIESRFWDKCTIAANGCWEWSGYLNPQGYGHFASETKKVMLVHRWTYQRFVGELIDGLQIDHLCRNTKCCNPDHLEQVSQEENSQRTVGLKFSHYARGDREYCKWGHEMTPDNSYKRPDRVNSYACRKCMVIYNRNFVARKGLRNG